jgi:signal transduction histidine kinase
VGQISVINPAQYSLRVWFARAIAAERQTNSNQTGGASQVNTSLKPQVLTKVSESCSAIAEHWKQEEKPNPQRDYLDARTHRRIAGLEGANSQLEQELAQCKRAEEKLEQRIQKLTLLNRLGQEFSAMVDIQEVMEHLPQAVADITNAAGASLWLWDQEQEGWLICKTAFQAKHKHRTPIDLRLQPGQGVVGWVAQRGESVVVPCAYEDPRFFPGIDQQTGFHTTSLLAAPVRLRSTIIGILEVVNKLDGAFDSDDLAAVETLATSAAIAFDNAVLFEALREQAAELRARNQELDAFAHTVAHDLKSPLGNLAGYTYLLQDVHPIIPQEKLSAYLDAIAQSAHQMHSIIDALLLLSSVRKMKTVDVQPLDMGCIAAQARKRLAYLIEEHQAQVILPQDWPVALGYAPWIEEVWTNYLSNAIKYGGQPPRVELGATIQPNGTGPSTVQFWLRDNGQGLSSTDQACLFTPFTQLHQAQIEGHGLGLSIVQRIVTKLGGQVGVESAGVPGQGSLFWFTLPRAKA